MTDVCTTVVIPFGAGDDPTHGPEVGSTDHFAGNGNFGVDYTAQTAANSSITGGATALSTDDTTTYASADVAGFDADMRAAYPGVISSGFFLSVKARQDTELAVQDDATVSAKVIVVARRGWDHDLVANLYGFTTDPLTVVYEFPTPLDVTTDGWVRYEADVDVSTVDAGFRTALAARNHTLLVSPSWSGEVTLGTYDVAYMALSVTHCPTDATSTPVGAYRRKSSIRQLQRGGPGGLGGIPRGYGVATSRGSLRRGPGTVR